jgi:hypothetical protein
MTNLYDAVAQSIRELDRQLESEPSGTGALVMIVTDGYENCSVEVTQRQLKQLIEERTKRGWTFTYMGADLTQQAAQYGAQSLGINANNAARYSKGWEGASYAEVGARTVVMAQNAGARGMAGAATESFFADAQGTTGLDAVTGAVTADKKRETSKT